MDVGLVKGKESDFDNGKNYTHCTYGMKLKPTRPSCKWSGSEEGRDSNKEDEVDEKKMKIWVKEGVENKSK